LFACLFLTAFGPSSSARRWAETAGPEGLNEWRQWRGPLATGEAPQGKPPLTWDEKTHVAWKAPLPGKGASTPIVLGERVFVLAAVDTGRQAAAKDIPKPVPGMRKIPKPPTTYHRWLVLCLDRKTGKVVWQRTAAEAVPHEGHHQTHSFAASSPTTDGKRLYVSFGSQGVFCYDLDGKPLWERHLGRMETRVGWGEGTSPALHKGTLYHTWDHENGSFLVALDAATGKTVWKKDRDEVTTWATPLVVEHQGKTQLVVPATKKTRGYDAATGEVLWECAGLTVNCIPSPVARDGVVYCMTGYRGFAGLAIPLGGRGDVTGKVLWKLGRGTPYVSSPLLAGGRLYFVEALQPLLTCVNAKDGKVLFRERLPGMDQVYCSPVAAAGRVYLADRRGTTVVLAQADTFKVLAVNRLGEAIDASPAVAGKQLFLRGEKHLYCIEE
jgi:outer membrane protein assembly factor BamB